MCSLGAPRRPDAGWRRTDDGAGGRPHHARGVDVVAADLVGRPVQEVEDELVGRGLRVELVAVETGEVAAGLVTAVAPTGTLAPDALVRLSYARPRPGARPGAGRPRRPPPAGRRGRGRRRTRQRQGQRHAGARERAGHGAGAAATEPGRRRRRRR